MNLSARTVVYGISTVIERMISLFMLPIVTKQCSEALFGVWTQVVVAVSFFAGFALLGIPTATVKYLSAIKDKDQRDTLYSSMSAIVLVCTLTICLAGILAWRPLSFVFFGGHEYGSYIFLLLGLLLSEVMFEFWGGIVRSENKILTLSVYYVIKNLTRMGVLGAMLLLSSNGLQYAMAVMIAAQLLVAMILYMREIHGVYRIRRLSLHAQLPDILRFSIPLVPYAVIVWLNVFLCRYFILHNLSLENVAAYSVAYSIASIVSVFYSILGYTIYPHLASLWNVHNQASASCDVRRANDYFLFCSIPLVAFLTVLCRPVVNSLSMSVYSVDSGLMLLLGMSFVLFGLYQINNYALVLAKRTTLALKIATVAVVINLLGNAVMVPRFGLIGAGITAVISNAALALWTWRRAVIHLPYAFPVASVVRTLIMTVIASVMVFFLRVITSFSDVTLVVIAFTAFLFVYIACDLLVGKAMLTPLVKSLMRSHVFKAAEGVG